MLRSSLVKFAFFLSLLVITLACRQSIQPAIPTLYINSIPPTSSLPTTPAPTQAMLLPEIRKAGDFTIESPTPDEPRELPPIRSNEEVYVIRAGDALGVIASRYNITVQMLIDTNQITNPDLLEVGQVLVIPAPVPGKQGSDFKIIPDSEFVYGPYAQSFSVSKFIDQYDSYLKRYTEEVEGNTMSGAEIVDMVAHDYSINPRLLLAILEYQGGWITLANPDQEKVDFPIGIKDSYRRGLYLQLSWAADNLNLGYYLWKVSGTGGWLLSSGDVIPIDPTINAGTAGVQHFFSQLYDRYGWDYAVSMEGLYATYSNFYGHPFDYAIEPLLPQDLEQPPLQLPFEPEVNWAFTGGPHGGWGSGSAWAALDFAPGNDGLGCVQSDLWVVAAADGPIIRAEHGRVIQDLDDDGNEGTGWIVLYMHIEARDRVEAGTYLKAGDRIGHPSCEGGFSTGTHVHLARRYNGEWIPADQANADNGTPFKLDGWVSYGDGIEYDGYLERDGETVEAWEGFFPANTIYR